LRVVSSGTEMQVHPATLHLHLVDLSFAVLLAFPQGSLTVVDCYRELTHRTSTTGSVGVTCTERTSRRQGEPMTAQQQEALAVLSADDADYQRL
jgi:hypothetical protein